MRGYARVARVRAFRFALLALFTGCAVGPNYTRPTTTTAPARWELQPPWREAAPKDAIPKTAWWTLFRDADLHAPDSAPLREPDPQGFPGAPRAGARHRHHTEGRPRSDTFSRPIGRRRGLRRPTAPPGRPAFSPICFKRTSRPVRRELPARPVRLGPASVESAQAAYQASAADLENVRLVLTAELAGDYFSLRQLDTELDVQNRSVANLERGVELITSRFKGGIASSLDVAQEETLLNSTRTQATLLLSQRKQYEDAIAVLVGTSAPGFHLAARGQLAEPPSIDVAVPSDVLERRPDVAEAERQMAAANARIGVAQAAFYPSIALSAQGGLNSTTLLTLFNAGSLFTTFAATLTQTVFDGGAHGGQLSYAKADYAASVAGYTATVLNAFREVQDNITGLEVLVQAQKSQVAAVTSSRRQLDSAMARYSGGLVSYLDVVIAQQALLSNELEAATVGGQRLVTAVALVKALGGGWDSASLAAVAGGQARLADAKAP